MTESTPNPTRLDALLTEGAFSNHQLVAASPSQLSHKNVQKARLGARPVTDKVAIQITAAVNALLLPEEPWTPRKLFPGFPRGKSIVPESPKP